jgi:charged multivesicular body protein 5
MTSRELPELPPRTEPEQSRLPSIHASPTLANFVPSPTITNPLATTTHFLPIHSETKLTHNEPPFRGEEQYAQADPQQRHLQCKYCQGTPLPHQPLTAQVDTRIESLDVKLAKLNAELSTYQQKLAKMRDGPGKTAIKQKALKVLQQRKQYEAQRDQLQAQSWNMEQAGMMQDNLKNTMTTIDAMKTTTKELRKQYGKVNIDKIDKLQDEMADLMDMGNDIQDAISRSYDVPEDVDESELDAELEALGDEVELDGIGESSSVPSYLMEDAPPQFIDEPPTANKVKEAAG